MRPELNYAGVGVGVGVSVDVMVGVGVTVSVGVTVGVIVGVTVGVGVGKSAVRYVEPFHIYIAPESITTYNTSVNPTTGKLLNVLIVAILKLGLYITDLPLVIFAIVYFLLRWIHFYCNV